MLENTLYFKYSSVFLGLYISIVVISLASWLTWMITRFKVSY